MLEKNMENWMHLARIRAKREADLARLSDAGRQFYERELRAGTGAERARQALRRIDHERELVSVRQFIYDNRYLGRTLKSQIFPQLATDLEEFFEGDYTEALLTGGIGWGKSRWVEIAVAYEIYQVSCLRDPAVTFGMISGSNVAFINISVTISQARKVLFEGLAGLMRSSPYFQEVFPYEKNLKTMLKFPKGVVAYPATASPEGVLGEGIFSVAFDEVNFMEIVERSKRTGPGESGLYDQAEAVYNKASSRITSRQAQLGRMAGHIYVISSARYPGDFTERMEKLAATPKGKHIFVRHYPTWGTRKASDYTAGTFKVEVGDLARRSRVLEGGETDVQQERVIEVPREFEDRFRADTERSVMDYAGIATMSIRPFIIRREMIERMFELGRKYGLKHPYRPVDANGIPLPVTLQQADPEIEKLVPENLHWVERPKLNELGRPMLRNNRPVMERIIYPVLYHSHIDLSKTKCATGLCVAHVIGTKKCPRLMLVEGVAQETVEEKPIIRVDLVLEIVAPPQGEVDIPKVRAVIYQLGHVGMEFGSVTFDTYGSQESVKTMKEKGYRGDSFSLDTDKEGYEALKDAIYDERIYCYDSPTLARELAQLEDTGKKIEKPSFPGASKDLADALAGAVWGCEEGWRHGERIGGLFELGIVEHAGEPKENPTRDRAITKVAQGGEALTPAEEAALTFGDFDDWEKS
jgi:hypothetical protein